MRNTRPRKKVQKTTNLRDRINTSRKNTPMEEHHSRRSHCMLCSRPDEVDDMVQCDKCDAWHHFGCVNVDASVKDASWTCERCSAHTKRDNEIVPNNSAANSSTPVTGGRRASLVQNQSNQSAPPGPYMQSNNRQLNPVDNPQPGPSFTQNFNASQNPHTAQNHNLSPWSMQPTPQQQRLPSSDPNSAVLDLQQRLLNMERMLQQSSARIAALELENNLLVQTQQHHTINLTTTNGTQEVNGYNADVGRSNPGSSRNEIYDANRNVNSPQPSSNTNVHPNEMSQSHFNQGQNAGYNLQPTLTPYQIMYRKTAKLDLPFFSGNPEEWPAFFSFYTQTTKDAGFTNMDNLMRLIPALKGPAKEYVGALMTVGDNVPIIISRLASRYGKPQRIIESHLARIRKMRTARLNPVQSLIEFGDAIHNLVASIKACKLESYLENPSLITELTKRLSSDLLLSWATASSDKPRNLQTFNDWLVKIVNEYSDVMLDAEETSHAPHTPPTSRKNHRRVHVTNEKKEKTRTCPICQNNCSSGNECNVFVQAHRSKRWALVKQYKLCCICLKIHRGDCYVTATCGKGGCTRRHHSLLHNDNTPKSATEATQTSNSTTGPQSHLSHNENTDSSLFRIVPVVLTNENNIVHTYAFIDDGSSVTLIDTDIANQLRLTGPNENLCLQWTNNQVRTENDSKKVNVSISRQGGNKYELKNVRTVKGLKLPEQTMNIDSLAERYPHLKGLPITSYENVRPMILIGIDNCHITAPQRIKEGHAGDPVAVKTRIGWSVFGQTQNDDPNAINTVGIHACTCQHLDDIGIVRNPLAILSHEEKRAKELLETLTIRRDSYFETGLLWKTDNVKLPNNLPMALKRNECLRKRLQSEPEMRENLDSQILQMEEAKFIKPLSTVEASVTTDRTWYLPIFPVLNPHKPGKVRIVYDAAAKYRGISLNDLLLKGADTLPHLVQPLNRFRQRKIGISGDIEKMFHMVHIREEDRHSQRLLYPKKDGSTQTYQMNVMTFGATCSPATAQYVKDLNASEHKKEFPEAYDCILNSHYVDDMVDSADTVQQAIKLAKDVRHVHSKAGFNLRNFKSNNEDVIVTLEGSKTAVNLNFEDTNEKILGIFWIPSEDAFTYSLKFSKIDEEVMNGIRMPTKREVLSILMSVFDPNGHLGHFLLQLKIVLQESWREGQIWDMQISDNQNMRWQHWLKQLPQIENIRIPRCYLRNIDNYTNATVQIHTFVDAGREAYTAVSFIRIMKGEEIDVAQIGSKTKVTPIAAVSIPRLELQAALIGARYTQHIKQTLSIDIHQTFFWTDSMTTLGWINSPKRYKPYVAFRISEIRELSRKEDWRFILSRHNVADEATKSKRHTDLSNSSRWMCGPPFLLDDERDWPHFKPNIKVPEEEEIKITCKHSTSTPLINFERFSNWSRLIRTQAYVHRFIEYAKGHKSPQKTLSAEELNRARMTVIHLAQEETFFSEIQQLQATGKVSKQSDLYKLSPYLDENKIIRIDSRTKCATGFVNPEGPIILPKKHHITQLIVHKMHQENLHQNHETVLNNLRYNYHIPNIRKVVRKIAYECQHCRVKNATPETPRMAPLPAARLAAFTPAFTFTGLDFFGPILVAVGRRQEKRWGCIFTCLTTRAIHIEVASSLNTSSFVMCLNNFMNRRGNVKHIYCDNGTNFVGTERLLRQQIIAMDKSNLIDSVVNRSIEWHFNPPHASHMGGSWERMIKTVKRALYESLPTRTPTEEVLRSALIEVENIVNSRPLTYIPVSDYEAPVLTPNDFLGIVKPHGIHLVPQDEPETLVNNYKTSQVIANSFWKKWVMSYLPEITLRSKWFEETENLKEGDLVIIVDVNEPRNCWRRGIVTRLIPSDDGRVRKAEVKTSTGIKLRAASKLAPIKVSSSWKTQPGGVSTTVASPRQQTS